jgi:hypothetical protein
VLFAAAETRPNPDRAPPPWNTALWMSSPAYTTSAGASLRDGSWAANLPRLLEAPSHYIPTSFPRVLARVFLKLSVVDGNDVKGAVEDDHEEAFTPCSGTVLHDSAAGVVGVRAGV